LPSQYAFACSISTCLPCNRKPLGNDPNTYYTGRHGTHYSLFDPLRLAHEADDRFGGLSVTRHGSSSAQREAPGSLPDRFSFARINVRQSIYLHRGVSFRERERERERRLGASESRLFRPFLLNSISLSDKVERDVCQCGMIPYRTQTNRTGRPWRYKPTTDRRRRTDCYATYLHIALHRAVRPLRSSVYFVHLTANEYIAAGKWH